jgi:hypothetical protein
MLASSIRTQLGHPLRHSPNRAAHVPDAHNLKVARQRRAPLAPVGGRVPSTPAVNRSHRGKGQAMTSAITGAVLAAGRRSSARSAVHILRPGAFPPCRRFAAMTAKSRENGRKIRESLSNVLPALVPGEAAYLVGASWLSGAGAAASWVARPESWVGNPSAVSNPARKSASWPATAMIPATDARCAPALVGCGTARRSGPPGARSRGGRSVGARPGDRTGLSPSGRGLGESVADRCGCGLPPRRAAWRSTRTSPRKRES